MGGTAVRVAAAAVRMPTYNPCKGSAKVVIGLPSAARTLTTRALLFPSYTDMNCKLSALRLPASSDYPAISRPVMRPIHGSIMNSGISILPKLFTSTAGKAALSKV